MTDYEVEFEAESHYALRCVSVVAVYNDDVRSNLPRVRSLVLGSNTLSTQYRFSFECMYPASLHA
jgi:hypothetical protein